MSLIINPMSKTYQVKMGDVTFTLGQLDYKAKAFISNACTSIKQGQVIVDSALQCFYNLKFGLRKVEGVKNEDGSDWNLTFEDPEKRIVHDTCIDELLNSPVSDNLIYVAREMMEGIPDKIVNPVTGQPLEGVELIVGGKEALKK